MSAEDDGIMRRLRLERPASLIFLVVLWMAAVTVAGQDPAVDEPPATPAAPSLDDLPPDFPLPKGTVLESGESRGLHRMLKLSVDGTAFPDLVSFFDRQLPEKDFRVLNQTSSLPRADFERACSFTVRARNGAVFGLLVVEKEGRLFVILEGRF